MLGLTPVKTPKDKQWHYLLWKVPGQTPGDERQRSGHLAPSRMSLCLLLSLPNPVGPQLSPQYPAPGRWDVVPLALARHPPGQGCASALLGNFTKLPGAVGVGCGFTVA